MSSADDWRRVCDGLARAAGETDTRALTRELYALASQTGAAVLRKRWGYDDDEAMDVVHDVLAVHWEQICEAEESPKALFVRVLTHRAIDRHRRRQREHPVDAGSAVAEAPPSPTARLELAQALSALRVELSPRDLRVFGARSLGVSSKEVASAEKLTVANVDQIMSRARARLKELFDADPE